MKTFAQIQNMLEEKDLLVSYLRIGEEYGIDGFRTMRVQGDFQHLLLVVKEEVWEDSISFMVEKGSLSEQNYRKMLERAYNNTPFQLMIVTDINAAEKALKEFLDEGKTKEETEPKQRTLFPKTLEEIHATPENCWVRKSILMGHCVYCGKALAVASYSPIFRYADCDCACGKAATEHNKRADEIEANRLKKQ